MVAFHANFMFKLSKLNIKMITAMKKIYFGITLMIISTVSFAQKGNPKDTVTNLAITNPIPIISSIVPPSPEAAALGKYGNVPVSLYTGTPNITIPIYEVKSKDISVPINLSYHASGVKVDEISSSVGMSWVLNAGGAIVRSVRGLPDEDSFGFRSAEMIDLWNKYKNGLMTASERISFEIEIANGTYDMQPDEYYYNFQGMSGMMLMKQDMNFFFSQHNKLKVEIIVDASNFENFIITDTNGFKYYFNDKEFSTPSALCNNNNRPSSIRNTSAWYLSKIESPTFGEVSFSYRRNTMVYNQGVYESFSHVTQNLSTCPPADRRTICTSRISSVIPYISEINFLNGKVLFSYNNRTDVGGGLRLDTIKVQDASGTIIKSHKLNYENTSVGDRYFLTSVVENTDISAISVPTYSLEYNNINSLPARGSVKQDYWGFCNNNTTIYLMPPLIFPNSTSYVWANREADASRVKYGILTNMTYPTGGKTVFDYEIHQYGFTGFTPNNPIKNKLGGGIRIKTITDYSDATQIATSKSYDYSMIDETDRSSGMLATRFAFQFNACTSRGCNGIPGSADYCSVYGNSNSSAALGSTQGASVGYQYVTETQTDISGNNGKTVYNFISFKDYVDVAIGYPLSPPFAPFTSKDAYRGKEKSIKYYNKDNNPVKEINFDYYFSEVSTLRGFKAMITDDNSLPNLSTIETSQYEYISLWFYLKQKRETLFIAP
jgi:hypothetical protein